MAKQPLAFALVFIALLLLVPSVRAQGTRSRVTGTIADSTGASVVGATVTLTNEATNTSLTTESSDSGAYVFDLVQPGTYTLAVDLAVPMIGVLRRKAERVILDTALKELRKRVEAG